MPPLTIPWPGGDIVLFADIGLYYVVLGLLVLVYLGLRILMNSTFGNVIVAIRENPERAEMLGYDMRKYQLVTFVIGAALAGLSRRALHGMGAIHHAVEHGHDRGGAAADLGRGRRAKRSHLDVDRNAGGAGGAFRP